MEFPKVGTKFAFTVKSTTARPPRTSEPELTVISGVKGKFKLNEAASKLLGLKPYDYLAFINNEDQLTEIREAYAAGVEEVVEEVDAEGGLDALKIQWAIAKGWAKLDANGVPQTTKKPLTNAEVAKLVAEGQVDENGKAIAPTISDYKGSRLASKMKEVKTGMILEGTDATNCPLLREGVSEDKHGVYAVNTEYATYDFENGNSTVSVDVYLISFKGEEDKIERE
jgi:hypothetical protein